MEKKYFEATVGSENGCDVAELTLWQGNGENEIAVHKTVSYDSFCTVLMRNRAINKKIKMGLFPKEVLSVVTGEREQTDRKSVV